MKEAAGSVVQLLRPVLDTYLDGAVGLIGCRSSGLAGESCEYDVLVIRPEHLPPASIKVGGSYVDLFFLTEAEATKPSPEFALSLASAKPVRDSTLVLSACTSAAQEALQQNIQRSADDRLAASIKAMGRAEESVSKGGLEDAGFWLLAAGYEFAFAWLYSNGTVPAPSHLLSQLRLLSRGQPGMYEAFSGATGLDGASRSACDERLDALGVLYDLRRTPGVEPEEIAPDSVRISYELLQRKSRSLLEAVQPVDSYCFLGLEVVRWLPRVLKRRGGAARTAAAASLSAGEDRLLADTVVRSLRVWRSERAVAEGLDALRVQVSALARKA